MKNSPFYDQLKIMWFALTASHAIFTFVSYTIMSQPSDVVPSSELVPALGGAAAVAALAGFLLPKMLSGKVNQADSPVDFNTKAQQYLTPFILRMALFETVTLFGFVASFLSRKFELMIPFVTVGAALALWSYPTEEKVKEGFR